MLLFTENQKRLRWYTKLIACELRPMIGFERYALPVGNVHEIHGHNSIIYTDP